MIKKYGAYFVSCLLAFICGALFIKYLNSGEINFAEAHIDKLTFNEAKIVALDKEGKDNLACRIDRNGAVFSGTVSAGEMHSVAAVAGRIYLSSTPIGVPLQQSKIYGEMAITDDGGAVFILRNAKGVNIPAQGGAKEGNALFIGYEINDVPSIFQQTLSDDPKKMSKNYLMRPMTDSEKKSVKLKEVSVGSKLPAKTSVQKSESNK